MINSLPSFKSRQLQCYPITTLYSVPDGIRCHSSYLQQVSSSSESDQDLGKKPPPSRPARKRRARGGGNNSKTNGGNGGRKNKKKKMDNNNGGQPSTVASAAADTLPLLRRESSEADVCSVCLDKPVHPVALECNHVFCFLCAKGLVEGADSQCSLCRRPIAKDYLKQDRLTQRTRSDLEAATEGVAGQQVKLVYFSK